MEKRLLLFLFLTFGIIFIWQYLYGPKPPLPGDPAPAQGTGDPSGKPAEGAGDSVAAPEKPVDRPPALPRPGDLPPRVAPGRGVAKTVDQERILWRLTSFGGSVERAQLKEFTEEPEQEFTEANWYAALSENCSDGSTPRESRSLTLDVLDEKGRVAIAAGEMLWELKTAKSDSVVYRLDLTESAGVVLEKEYSFPLVAEGIEGGPYHLNLVVRLTVTDLEKARRYGAKRWRVRLTGAGGMPVDLSARAPATASVFTGEMVSPEEFKADDEVEIYPKPEHQGDRRAVRWVGLYSRFFTAILKADDPDELLARQAVILPVRDIDKKGRNFDNVAPAIDFSLPLNAGGDPVERGFLFYVGPMDPDILGEGPYDSFGEIINYGWFEFIAKPLVWLLGVIHSVVGNWGVAIILLTLLIRMGMFPLSRKQQVSMQRYQKKMAKLKPKMDVIKERHKNNKKKQNEEMMKLMKEEGGGMFPAGCLVMFLQLPIFIGLFQSLRYSIGLRHSSFLWATDLTSPDQLLGPFSTAGIPLIPDPFSLNLFPIVMGITWYLSSAMTPKPADPQQAQTMKMMKWMPVIFSIMLYSYPAGLALYMVVSSSWSIFEMKVVRKLLLKEEPVAAGPAPTFRKGK